MWDFAHYTYRMRGYVGGGTSSGLTPTGVPGIVGGQPNNHFYAFTAGNVRFVMVSTEAYFYYNASQIQYAWLDGELGRVDRAATPWVVVVGHRSVYCSCDSDCDADAATVRDGPLGLEALLVKHGVDVWLNGHEHNFERNYPTLRGALAPFARGGGAPGGDARAPEVVLDPEAPVYVVVGHAGNVEGHELFDRPAPAHSAFRSATFGYARVTVLNASALLLEAVLADPGQPAGEQGRTIDAMLLVTDHRVGGAPRVPRGV
jgi:hypothetical protein